VLAVVVQLFASDTVTVYVPATSPLAVAVVAKVAELVEVLHAKLYGDVPPVPLAVAEPLLPPLQLTLVFEALPVNPAGSVMVTLDVLVHEFASDTVTVYVPVVTPVMLDVVAKVAELVEVLHAKVYGVVPPVPLAVADPLLPPLQLTFVFANVDAANTAGSVIVTLDVLVHEFASVTVTVYVPAVTPVMLAVVAKVAELVEVLHAYE
jgi:hypothetical protein